jgi:hypothetical protein
MQNVRPAGFARPQTGQVGPVVASDGAADTTGGVGVIGSGGTGGVGGVAAPGTTGAASDSTAATWGAPASWAANSRNAPQLPQNASPAAFGVPHFAQIIPLAFASIRAWSRAA